MSPFPRRDTLTVWQVPKSSFFLFGLGFELEQGLILGVFPIDPRCAASDHFCIDVHAVHEYPADRAPVMVGVHDRDCHRLAENQAGQFLFRFVAIGLFGFRGINLGQPDFDLLVASSKKFEGIAIGTAK